MIAAAARQRKNGAQEKTCTNRALQALGMIVAAKSIKRVFLMINKFQFMMMYFVLLCVSCVEKPNGPSQNTATALDTINFTMVADSAGFSRRFAHTSLVFQNKMWILGGTPNSQSGEFPIVSFNDIWFSTDGQDWSKATDSAWTSGKFGHSSVVFNGKMWVISGAKKDTNKFVGNDVWCSSDGIKWDKIADSAAFPGRFYSTALVFENKLWMFGGYKSFADTTWLAGNEPINDIWNSTDGISWNKVLDSIPVGDQRVISNAIVFGNKIWAISYRRFVPNSNDVWSSNDGIIWVQAVRSINLGGDHQSITIYREKMWITGGLIGSYFGGQENNAIFCSGDGSKWGKVICESNFSPGRFRHTSLEYNGRLWVIAGYIPASPYRANDVWCSKLIF